MFNAEQILIIHEINSQDFPSSQTVNRKRIFSLFEECKKLFLTQSSQDPFVFAACVAFKLATEKPFGDANNKTAVRCIMSILSENDIEIDPPYLELKNIIEEVEDGRLSFEVLIKELKAL